MQEGSRVYACKICFQPTKICPVGDMKSLYDLISRAERVLVF